MSGSGSAITEADATNVAENACAKFANLDDWATKQAAVANALANLTDTLYTNMQAAADAQAALEKAWLQAWYLQQYWSTIRVLLDENDAPAGG